MFFSQRLSLSGLISLCRVLRHNLGAGLTLRDVFRQQSERGGREIAPLAQRIRVTLEQGDSLQVALQKERAYFPPLFLAMASVGEETGHLPEIFGELESYYTMQLSLRRQFRSQSLLPMIQFVAALLIIALLIFVLGMIAASRNTTPMSVFGLRGASGALIFLVISFGSLTLAYVAYRWLSARQGQRAMDALLLRVPGLGPCLEALILGRFSLALSLTLDSRLPITEALALSLDATGNAVYQARKSDVVQALKNGHDLTSALTQAGVFPEDFLNMVATGEEGGRVPEIMRHQAKHYHEEAEIRLKTFTRMMSMGVWLVYAVFMIIAIFSIARQYLGALGV
jgi:type IV pilus assembly protein PilC